MKSNEEILDLFGKYVGSDAFDSSYGSIIEILNGTCPNPLMKDKIELFNRFSPEEKKIIKEYIYDLISGTLFDFLRIFEEHPEFKILYEENGNQVDLNKISEMLKAEPIIENGWLQRFSNEIKNEDSAGARCAVRKVARHFVTTNKMEEPTHQNLLAGAGSKQLF